MRNAGNQVKVDVSNAASHKSVLRFASQHYADLSRHACLFTFYDEMQKACERRSSPVKQRMLGRRSVSSGKWGRLLASRCPGSDFAASSPVRRGWFLNVASSGHSLPVGSLRTLR